MSPLLFAWWTLGSRTTTGNLLNDLIFISIVVRCCWCGWWLLMFRPLNRLSMQENTWCIFYDWRKLVQNFRGTHRRDTSAFCAKNSYGRRRMMWLGELENNSNVHFWENLCVYTMKCDGNDDDDKPRKMTDASLILYKMNEEVWRRKRRRRRCKEYYSIR